jgi:hypothetical protein
MNKSKMTPITLIIGGAMLLVGIALWLSSGPVYAQCGSQASSCKNCHEIQGQDPVNNDGTGWHQSHAFGDFCYVCHAGNNQSMVAEEAHAGMVPPMSDVKAACQACHPGDLMERSQVYATALGVEIGAGGGTAGSSGGDSAPAAPSGEQPAAPPAAAVVIANSDVIDYNQRYAETVLGQRTINWGNVVLWLLLTATTAGGGAFVYWNERRLRGLPLISKRAAPPAMAEIPIVEGYSKEVSALLPLLSQLNPVGLHALKRLLQNPEDASTLLVNLSQLDPILLQRMRTLDPSSRNLLLALAGD